MVFATPSGEISPDSNTLEPSLVTSRSSARVFKRCATTLAIFNLHEFEPISIAANVGIGFLGSSPGGREFSLCGQDTRPARLSVLLRIGRRENPFDSGDYKMLRFQNPPSDRIRNERHSPQGLKPADFEGLAARLKSCPDTKQARLMPVGSDGPS